MNMGVGPAVQAMAFSDSGIRGDPASSVLDENAEAHGFKRLFVADNSALPNSLGGPNPTLTADDRTRAVGRSLHE